MFECLSDRLAAIHFQCCYIYTFTHIITDEAAKKVKMLYKMRHQITIDSFKFNLFSHRFHYTQIQAHVRPFYSLFLVWCLLVPALLSRSFIAFSSSRCRFISSNRFSSFFFYFRRFFIRTNSPCSLDFRSHRFFSLRRFVFPFSFSFTFSSYFEHFFPRHSEQCLNGRMWQALLNQVLFFILNLYLHHFK